jgi:hypothetical protein
MTEKLRRKPDGPRTTRRSVRLSRQAPAGTACTSGTWSKTACGIPPWPGTSKQVMRFGEHRHILCLGCLEARLGRQLHSGDFTPAPINDATNPRILARMRIGLSVGLLANTPRLRGHSTGAVPRLPLFATLHRARHTSLAPRYSGQPFRRHGLPIRRVGLLLGPCDRR